MHKNKLLKLKSSSVLMLNIAFLLTYSVICHASISCNSNLKLERIEVYSHNGDLGTKDSLKLTRVDTLTIDSINKIVSVHSQVEYSFIYKAKLSCTGSETPVSIIKRNQKLPKFTIEPTNRKVNLNPNYDPEYGVVHIPPVYHLRFIPGSDTLYEFRYTAVLTYATREPGTVWMSRQTTFIDTVLWVDGEYDECIDAICSTFEGYIGKSTDTKRYALFIQIIKLVYIVDENASEIRNFNKGFDVNITDKSSIEYFSLQGRKMYLATPFIGIAPSLYLKNGKNLQSKEIKLFK